MPNAIESLKTADLKAKFSEGAVPLAEDFADLIDLADYGRALVGKSPSNNPVSVEATGLLVDENGHLKVNVDGTTVRIVEGQLAANFSETTLLNENTIASFLKVASQAQYSTLKSMGNQNFMLGVGYNYGSGSVKPALIRFKIFCFNSNGAPYMPFDSSFSIQLNSQNSVSPRASRSGFEGDFSLADVKSQTDSNTIHALIRPSKDAESIEMDLTCNDW